MKTETIDPRTLDAFTRSYIETALWSSTDEDGESLDGLYTADDIAEDTLAEMVLNCFAFRELVAEAMGPDVDVDTPRGGHDFWLTRNGHGAGYWDGDWERGGELTKWAKSFGSFDLHIGDDGNVHGA